MSWLTKALLICECPWLHLARFNVRQPTPLLTFITPSAAATLKVASISMSLWMSSSSWDASFRLFRKPCVCSRSSLPTEGARVRVRVGLRSAQVWCRVKGSLTYYFDELVGGVRIKDGPGLSLT